MFSKYSGFDIPQNYSGNRFKKAPSYETSTKTHTSTEYSAIKSSVSPTYQNQISMNEIIQNDAENEAESENEYIEEEIQNPMLIRETAEEVCEIDTSDNDCNVEKKPFQLNDILSKFNSEDLLLICLIVFLSLDKSINNSDIIILLSLLLAR